MNDATYLPTYHESNYMYSMYSTDSSLAQNKEEVEQVGINKRLASQQYVLQQSEVSDEYLRDVERNYWVKALYVGNYLLGIFVLFVWFVYPQITTPSISTSDNNNNNNNVPGTRPIVGGRRV